MIFPEEESLHNLWPIKALQSTVHCYHNRSVYFLLLLVNVVKTIGILHDVLVCCVCVITFVPEIIWRVTFGQPLWIVVVFVVVVVFFHSSWLLIIINAYKGGIKFLKKLWCCLRGRVYQDNLVLSIKLIRFKKMTFWVLALRQHNWAEKRIVSF